MTPQQRILILNDQEFQEQGEYVLYWMIAHRRHRYNFSLQHAIEAAQQLSKPLLIFEALRVDYDWASDRLHRFILQGMADNRDAFADKPVRYYCYVEPRKNESRGLLQALADKATLVVTDDFPCFFLKSMVAKVAKKLAVPVHAVDSNGLFPMRATQRVFTTAYSFRSYLQKNLAPHLEELPLPDPFAGADLLNRPAVSREILDQWPEATPTLLTATPAELAALPIDHEVRPANFDGGSQAANATLQHFLKHRLQRYSEHRNDVEQEAASGLSPYLHFGHLSAHEVFHEIASAENWSPADLSEETKGSRSGWWGVSENSESFLDELITWRELGYNMCSHRDDYDQYETLPDFALKTLDKHASDTREHHYSLTEFETAQTHDEIWNAAQTELVQTGRMHNYLRMLWGKKILEWTSSPREALQVMIHLNNKYAVDGRNPNSYSGIFWVLGRYDRAWGPEREIFGKVRYMSSDSTRKKLKLNSYLEKFGERTQQTLF